MAALQVAPLPIIDLIYWAYCKRHFSRPLQMLSLEAAADLDRKDEVLLTMRYLSTTKILVYAKRVA